jgi:prophage antirepressor-like protein
MSAIVPFVFKHGEDKTPIRAILIDNDGWFVNADVCSALGVEDSRVAIRKLKPYQKGEYRIPTPGGPQMMTIISESGLYKLAMRSDKPQAEPFQDWIAEEVIPSIRRTGRYELASSMPEPDLLAAINRVDARLGRIEVKLDDGRRNFPPTAVRYVGEGNAKHENCECIYCRIVPVVTQYGEPLDTCNEHHVDGNKANKSQDNLTLPCIECHKRITNKNRPDHIPSHLATAIAVAFHDKLKQKARQIRPPSATAGLWDFRGATQVDMGFPQAAKQER